MANILAVIMAGGRGERLGILAHERTKPAIPFGGKYRIIDFTISNSVNSGISNIAVLTQYQPLSLTEHIGVGAPWGLARLDGGGIRLIQPYLAPDENRGWYKGTADAVYQNLQYIEQQNADLVLVLSGDHLYTMDYTEMAKAMEETQADVILATTPMPYEELIHFGTVSVDDESQVMAFQEKVRKPESNLVSMGVYLFRKEALFQCLEQDAQLRSSKHDFGRDILPRMVNGNYKLFSYNFRGYWRDVGTVSAYWQANMDLLELHSSLLFDSEWPIRTAEVQRPPAVISNTASVVNSIISMGCVIEGTVEHSVLSPGVRVAENAVVKDSVILDDCVIGPHSIVDYSIMDKEAEVGAGCHIGSGENFQVNRRHPTLVNTGLNVIGKRARIPDGTKMGHNCIVYYGATEDNFPIYEIRSGETIRKRRKGAAPPTP